MRRENNLEILPEKTFLKGEFQRRQTILEQSEYDCFLLVDCCVRVRVGIELGVDAGRVQRVVVEPELEFGQFRAFIAIRS